MYGALLLFESEFVHVVAISFTALILTELLMVALTVRTWHWLMVVAELFSLACYLASLAILSEYFGGSSSSVQKKFPLNLFCPLKVSCLCLCFPLLLCAAAGTGRLSAKTLLGRFTAFYLLIIGQRKTPMSFSEKKKSPFGRIS